MTVQLSNLARASQCYHLARSCARSCLVESTGPGVRHLLRGSDSFKHLLRKARALVLISHSRPNAGRVTDGAPAPPLQRSSCCAGLDVTPSPPLRLLFLLGLPSSRAGSGPSLALRLVGVILLGRPDRGSCRRSARLLRRRAASTLSSRGARPSSETPPGCARPSRCPPRSRRVKPREWSRRRRHNPSLGRASADISFLRSFFHLSKRSSCASCSRRLRFLRPARAFSRLSHRGAVGVGFAALSSPSSASRSCCLALSRVFSPSTAPHTARIHTLAATGNLSLAHAPLEEGGDLVGQLDLHAPPPHRGRRARDCAALRVSVAYASRRVRPGFRLPLELRASGHPSLPLPHFRISRSCARHQLRAGGRLMLQCCSLHGDFSIVKVSRGRVVPAPRPGDSSGEPHRHGFHARFGSGSTSAPRCACVN